MKTSLVVLVIPAVAGIIIYFLNQGESIQDDSSDGRQAAVTETKTGSTTTITSKDILEFISRSSKTSNEYGTIEEARSFFKVGSFLDHTALDLLSSNRNVASPLRLSDADVERQAYTIIFLDEKTKDIYGEMVLDRKSHKILKFEAQCETSTADPEEGPQAEPSAGGDGKPTPQP